MKGSMARNKKIKINWLFVMYCHFFPSTNPGIDVTPFDIGFINESNVFNNVVNILLLQLPVIHRFYQYYGFLAFSWGVIKKEMQIKIEHWHSAGKTQTGFPRQTHLVPAVKSNEAGIRLLINKCWINWGLRFPHDYLNRMLRLCFYTANWPRMILVY